MDLANAPDLKNKGRATGAPFDRYCGFRVLCAEQARTPEFVAQWQDIANRAAEPNPFFEPWFCLPSLEFLTPSASGRPRVSILAHFTKGQLTGVMPIEQSREYYGYPVPHFSAWLHANAFYGAPLVIEGFEHDFWTDLLSHFDARPGLALFAHLPLLEQGGPLDAALDAILSASRRNTSVVLRRERALHASSLSAEHYLDRALSKKHRKELRRQRRRLSEHGELTVERRSDDFGLKEWIAEFLALETAGWKGDAGSSLAGTPATRNFFTACMRGAASVGKLDRIALRLDGKPIAMLTSFVTAPGCYSFKTAFDERYSAHSPGMQLQIDNLTALDRPNIEWTDSCAAEGHPMIDRLWTERRRLVSRNVAIGGRLRRAAFARLSAYENRSEKVA
ncbi:GNAT family N-acetyltransferase [Erythrobacter insulae]|uniref:GNAT family N-acetyltransferase n=1 Tax=Erythrobacter insulae TaxID=2584124 RepID=A0A547P8Y1_9SPHN|nr:GNAT family N-acetyltransferase [Erythrobacter insulae]TRD10573.1 GNAT family N-acetyltransferase [Erythrobacter insulae]